MADIRPFKAFRPTRDKVHLVASRSYVSYSKKALRSKLDENPFTFLHILNPEYRQKKQSNANSVERFKKTKAKFEEFVHTQILTQDEQENYYVYRQIKNGHPYLGIIACASVEDYFNDTIKKHEATLTHREEIFKNYLKTVEINAEPVCFTYPNHERIDEITQETILQSPEYDFTTTNRVRHTFWIISTEEKIKELRDCFAALPSIYIADGHHRSASSALLGKELKEANPAHTGEEAYNFFMGYFIPESHIQVFEFNRMVTSIGDLSVGLFLKKLQEKFEVIFVEGKTFRPEKTHEIGMYIAGKWYCLIPKEALIEEHNPVQKLDVSILTEHILSPILGIHDLKTDERIYFKGGLEDIQEIMKEVDQGLAEVAFTHYPVSIHALKEIADRGEIMPPKSTWVEPKLRSGLSIFSSGNDE